MIETPEDWESVQNLALALCWEARDFLRGGDFESAERQLRRAIACDTYCLRAYEWLEYVLDLQGRFEEACELHEFKRRAALELALAV